MADEKRKPMIKVMTPKGVARFPVLNKPDTKFNPDGDFKVGVILPADALNEAGGAHKGKPIMQMLEDAAQEAFNDAKADLEESIKTLKGEKLAKAKKALAELKLGDLPAKPVYDEEGNETGEVVVTFKMKAQRKDRKTGALVKMVPQLFDANLKPIRAFDSQKNPIPDAVQIWGGSILKVAGTLNPFYMPGTSTAGVGLRLSAAQVIELRSSGGGDGASYGFGKEDGYEAQESPSGDSSESSAPWDEEDGAPDF